MNASRLESCPCSYDERPNKDRSLGHSKRCASHPIPACMLCNRHVLLLCIISPIGLICQLARCIAKVSNFPCQGTASLLLRGGSHLEIVIIFGLFQMDLLLDRQATDLSSNYVGMAVLSHRGSDSLCIHAFCN